jgi:hypothetical protein
MIERGNDRGERERVSESEINGDCIDSQGVVKHVGSMIRMSNAARERWKQ